MAEKAQRGKSNCAEATWRAGAENPILPSLLGSQPLHGPGCALAPRKRGHSEGLSPVFLSQESGLTWANSSHASGSI